MYNLYLIVIFSLSLLLVIKALNYLPHPASQGRNITLDAFRGLLAPLVLCHHFVLTYHFKVDGVWGLAKNKLVSNIGAIPVSMFFMITGYLFIGKICRGGIHWRELAINRALRIYPLFIFVLGVIYTIYFFYYKGHATPGELIFSFREALIFNLPPLNGIEIASFISGAHWTLIYEAVFYLSLPILALLNLKTLSVRAILCAALPAIILYSSYHTLGLIDDLFTLFAYGGLAYAIASSRFAYIFRSKLMTYIALVTLIYALFFSHYYTYKQMFLISISFCCIAAGNDMFGLLKNRGLTKLGDISYSIYLTHGFILYILFTLFNLLPFADTPEYIYYLLLPAIMALACGVAIITYTYIESPFLTINAKLKTRLFKKDKA